jgi:catechol 2,3-dioxygenase
MTSIAPTTRMGAVHLAVTEGQQSAGFYESVVGLTRLDGDGDGSIRLGAHGVELVVLHPGARRGVLRGTSGLYHLAIVVPSRRELARVVARLMNIGYPQSPTDHVMTKSDYFWDPDGNGIEIYAETPEDGTWEFANGTFRSVARDGTLRSGVDPIDVPALLAELRPGDALEEPLAEGSRMGHVHLHVHDLGEAVDFYSGTIGFDVQGVADRWGAAFVSAGGYHHHVGLNVWAGVGAPQAPDDAAGLRHFTVELPTRDDLETVNDRLADSGFPVGERTHGVFVRDPSGNRVNLTTQE